jgi:exodeoxyribonuclease VII large subunit
LQRERGELNQKIREIRAASERGLGERLGFQRRIATVVLERARQRGLEGTLAAAAEERQRGTAIERSASRSLQRRRETLRKAVLTLRAHDPERTLERGYALAETAAGEPVTSASAARAADEISLRFADGRVDVRPARGGRGSE